MDQNDLRKLGPILEIKKVKRRQKRKKRRNFEASEQDWAAWDATAASMGLNFAEFVRRALNAAAAKAEHEPEAWMLRTALRKP